MQCTKCKSEGHLSRLKRTGFLQEHILSRAGYYPWRCSFCTQRIFLRARSTVEGFTRESESNPEAHPAPNKDDLHRVR
jgi:hypothetical protein